MQKLLPAKLAPEADQPVALLPVGLRRGARPAALPLGPVALRDRQTLAQWVQARPASAAYRMVPRIPGDSIIPATIPVARAIPQKRPQLRAPTP